MHRFVSQFGRLPLAPFPTSILVCVPLWISNSPDITYEMILPAALMLLASSAILLVGIWLGVRNWARASLIAAIWINFLLYLPSIVRAVTENQWAMCAVIVFGGVLAWDLSRRIPKDGAAARQANGAVSLFLGISAIVMACIFTWQQFDFERGRPEPRNTFAPFPGKADVHSPDVWHIVMDRYAGQETLSRTYGFDNSAFLSVLHERGFSVARDAYSNYQITPLSLASTLNASYLDTFTSKLGRADDRIPMFRAIDHNAAFDFFKRQGYQVIFAGGWANVTFDNSQADRKIAFRSLSEVSRTVLNQSVPGVIAEMLGLPFADGRKDQCLREKYKFDRLQELAGQPGRKYVFAHFLVPHPPYVFTADGTCQSVAQARKIGRTSSYVAQVEYSNDALLRLVDGILKGPRPATIVLHADEGPYPAKYATDEREFNPTYGPGENYLNDTPNIRRDKTNIILAIRHADGRQDKIPISPVNIYPAITNHSFGTNLSFKPDRTFMFGWDLDYRNMRDISSETFGSAR